MPGPLSCDTTYYWRIRAVKPGTGQFIQSLWSEPRSFTVAPVPDEALAEIEDNTNPVETWEEFIIEKKLGLAEIQEFKDYISESAKHLGMDAKELRNNAVKAGDLEDMLEAVMAGKKDEPTQGNWWDISKHWFFREKDALKDLILYGFGDKMAESDVCQNNPGSNNTLKQALPETKKAIVKKYDKMFGAGEFNKLIGK